VISGYARLYLVAFLVGVPVLAVAILIQLLRIGQGSAGSASAASNGLIIVGSTIVVGLIGIALYSLPVGLALRKIRASQPNSRSFAVRFEGDDLQRFRDLLTTLGRNSGRYAIASFDGVSLTLWSVGGVQTQLQKIDGARLQDFSRGEVALYRGANVPCLMVALDAAHGAADSLRAVPSDHVLAAIIPMGAASIDRLVADLNHLRVEGR
jgi:hypothetical protein